MAPWVGLEFERKYLSRMVIASLPHKVTPRHTPASRALW